MERIVVNRSATLKQTFYVDGVATDPTGTPTVVVTRANGTVVTTGAVTDDAAAGTWSVTIPSSSNTLLDTLTLTWSGVVNGSTQTYVDTVEVAGAVLFNLDQARTAIGDAAYDAAKIADARTYAEDEIERAIGYALTPRYARETLIRRGMQPRVRWPYVRSVRSVSIDGVAVTGSSLTSILPAPGRLAEGPFWSGFYTWGGRAWSTIVVGYEHGLDNPPPGAQRAALELAIDYLGAASTSIDSRAIKVTTVDGTLELRTGGQFGLQSVDQFIASARLPVVA